MGKTKKTLQIRFVLIAVLALFIMQTLIIGFSTLQSYMHICEKSDRLIMQINNNPNAEDAKELRFFQACYDVGSGKLALTLDNSLIEERHAAMIAKDVLNLKKDKGFIERYRFLVAKDKDEITITFLSRAMVLDTMKANTMSMVSISFISLIVMTILLIAISSIVTSPIVKSHEKQKQFITSASHELKTPLTVISADAQLLESEIGENEWLVDIIKQTEKMSKMTKQLVYLAKLEETDTKLEKISFPISDVAYDIAYSYQSVANSNGKKYEIDIERNLTYFGDEKAIRMLMSILLDNAFKYSNKNAAIRFSLHRISTSISLVVENEVEGISEEAIDKFTDRFYRASGNQNIEGFGIGLSIAQKIAEAHKGKIKISLEDKSIIKISIDLK